MIIKSGNPCSHEILESYWFPKSGNPCSGTSICTKIIENKHETLESYWFPKSGKLKEYEVTGEDLLDIWRDLLQSEFPDVDLFDIEYITVDGTTNEYDDRGLDFDILSNTKE